MATAWADLLPVLDEAELVQRRFVVAAIERWSERGLRIARALPRAVLGLWPLTAPETAALRLVLGGQGAERHLTLDQFPLRLGRGDACPLQLPHAAVSTEHAELRVERGQVFLMDLRSTNGTRRNGEALVPLVPVPLLPGDRIDVGPFQLTVLGLGPLGKTGAFEARATEAEPREREGLFRALHRSDRLLRVRIAGDPVFLRVPTAWMQACWQRSSGIASETIGPMEEGAAQYVFDRVARALATELQEEVELSGWLQAADAEREARGSDPWLTSELLLRSGDASFPSTAFIPVRRQEAAPYEASPSLAFPARVVLGTVRLPLSDFAALEPGDALIPDAFFPRGLLEVGKAERGPCWLKVRSFWFGATLLASEAGATLRLDQTWLRSPGEDWLMADDDAIDRGAGSVPVSEIELSVQIELDRFPVTLGELQKWRPGEIVSLRAGLSDPVKLVVETGLQRRVLGEGRVVVVNGKLGVEILRVVTRFEDQPPPRP